DRRSAFSWKAYGVSIRTPQARVPPRSAAPSRRAKSSRWTLAIVGAVSPEPMIARIRGAVISGDRTDLSTSVGRPGRRSARGLVALLTLTLRLWGDGAVAILGSHAQAGDPDRGPVPGPQREDGDGRDPLRNG